RYRNIFHLFIKPGVDTVPILRDQLIKLLFSCDHKFFQLSVNAATCLAGSGVVTSGNSKFSLKRSVPKSFSLFCLASIAVLSLFKGELGIGCHFSSASRSERLTTK